MGWISYIKFLGLNFTTFKKSIKNGLDYTNIFYGLELTIVGVGKNHPDYYSSSLFMNISWDVFYYYCFSIVEISEKEPLWALL